MAQKIKESPACYTYLQEGNPQMGTLKPILRVDGPDGQVKNLPFGVIE